MNSKEAAEMFGLTTDKIRYYKRAGIIPRKERVPCVHYKRVELDLVSKKFASCRCLNRIFSPKSAKNTCGRPNF
ncbi:hypothetical protein BCR22_02190 [Enterococcus plantarum]|nr:hypothetical protein BCR22_02190 [Enterococcus plantarum]